MKKRTVIGAGQCGMKLASQFFHENSKLFDGGLYNLSTSSEDSVNIPKSSLVQVSKDGSGKKFSRGNEIWTESYKTIKSKLNNIYGNDVVYFASAGGGSGSSSLHHISDLLIENNNRVLLVLVLPFDYENLPYKPNALQALSKLQDSGYTEKMSIMLFDNEKLSSIYYDSERIDEENVLTRANLEKINNYITKTTSIALDLVEKYHADDKFTPFSIDALEHESVIFSKGFIGVTFSEFLEQPYNIKFEYGKLSDCKNIVIAKAVGLKESDYLINENTGKFLDVVKKTSKKAKNARVMYGIIRTNEIEQNTFVIIGNNLDISKYITKTKKRVSANIEKYKEVSSREKVFSEDEAKKFDI